MTIRTRNLILKALTPSDLALLEPNLVLEKLPQRHHFEQAGKPFKSNLLSRNAGGVCGRKARRSSDRGQSNWMRGPDGYRRLRNAGGMAKFLRRRNISTMGRVIQAPPGGMRPADGGTLQALGWGAWGLLNVQRRNSGNRTKVPTANR